MKDIFKKNVFAIDSAQPENVWKWEQTVRALRSKIDLESIYILHNNIFFNAIPINWIFYWNFKKSFCLGKVFFWQKKTSEKTKQSVICPSFCGNMPEAQIWKVPFGNPFYLRVRVRVSEFTRESYFLDRTFLFYDTCRGGVVKKVLWVMGIFLLDTSSTSKKLLQNNTGPRAMTDFSQTHRRKTNTEWMNKWVTKVIVEQPQLHRVC